jgi:prolyl-tRNA editing enzyme YbaK/EbsC (Cys-tRNA(Pro) deacylase)/predicted Fe-S protein YdhL (DUF1289 family)
MSNPIPDPSAALPERVREVAAWLAERAHADAPRWLDVSARTAQEAADALGVALGQIAKSVIFRRLADDVAVLVVTSGDRRVDEAKVVAQVGAIGRADAAFVRARTGFVIGGVAPVAHRNEPVVLLDRDLWRFESIWAAAGHPKAVFRLVPDDLRRLCEGAAAHDVTESVPPSSPCIDVCKLDPVSRLCEGCLRSIDEIAGWSSMSDDARRQVLQRLPGRRSSQG